jgi:hypothetical protein
MPGQRLDQHPRPDRRNAKKPDDGDDAALHRLDEREYRERLFADFVKYCRDAGAWVVTPPSLD